jgi:flavin reductase (DIM6/NTAB) family NADH-FMN oxidoreductase RutF
MTPQHAYIDAMAAAVAGVNIVTSTTADGRPIGRTVSAMLSVSAEPPLLLVSIRSTSPLATAIAERGEFAVNVLAAGQAGLSDAFAGRGERPHEFLPGQWEHAAVPLLHGAAARFVCRVRGIRKAGTHSLILGSVVRSERGAAAPLAYTRRGYAALERTAA